MNTIKLTCLGIVICFTACRPILTTTLEADLFEDILFRTESPQLVDVRTPKEYNEEHIPNSINIDIKSKDFENAIMQLDIAKPVFVYCRSGKRSMEAANLLEKNRFKVVYNLGGGINAWKAKSKATNIMAGI